ncbi:MAG TPA: PIN domain-containing protein [Stellaceae bacterium]|nr:PIN domain-containing protein [Stellaceae bacterium]
MPGVLLDTGPLVAYLYPRDAHHDWAVGQFAMVDPPFLTCEPVLTETCFLIARNRQSTARVFHLLDAGVIRLAFAMAEELPALQALTVRYANVPMSLADACLVRMAERTGWPICTLDADFMIYRAHGRNALDVIAPHRALGLHEP